MSVRSNRSRATTAAALALLLTATPVGATAQTQNARGDGPTSPAEGEQVWNVLPRFPYAAQGRGPVVYVLAYSTCPYTAAFFRDWHGDPGGVQLRWVFFPVDEPTRRSTADVALTRDPAVVAALINGQRTAPPGNFSQPSVDAFNQSVLAYARLNQVFANFHHEHIISPTFIWKVADTVWVARGYNRASFARILLPSARRGTGQLPF